MAKHERIREAARQAMESGSFRELAKLHNEKAVELVAEVLAKHTATMLEALHDLVTPRPAVAKPVEVMDAMVKEAAIECARRAYGYWKGDSTGGDSAMRYFDGNMGLGGIAHNIDMMEAAIRKHMAAALTTHPTAQETFGELEASLLAQIRIITKQRDDARAALTAQPHAEAKVPDGRRLVPIEPTDAMLDAIAWHLDEAQRGPPFFPKQAYEAMLSAAPLHPDSGEAGHD